MNPNNKRPRDNETSNTSNANKKSKGENENERLWQEIEYQRQVNEQQRQKIEQQRQKIEQQRQEIKLFRHPSKCNRLGPCAKCTQVNCMNGRHSDSLPCAHCGEDFSRGKSTKQSTIDFLRDFPGEKPKVLDRNEANQWIKDVPKELWLEEIMPYFSVKELSLASAIAKHFEPYWKTFKNKRKLSVPKDFPTLREAVRVGEILSRRAIMSSTNENLLKIMLSNGVHNEDGERVCINYPISIIGESRDGCKIIGGLNVGGELEDNVYIKKLTLWKSKNNGIRGCEGHASFHLDSVCVEKSESFGVAVCGTTRNTMINCRVMHSHLSGVAVWKGGLLTISGSATSIHTNANGSHAGSSSAELNTGLYAPGTILLQSLGKEILSSSNKEGVIKYIGRGPIKSVDKDGKVLEVVYDGQVPVPVVELEDDY